LSVAEQFWQLYSQPRESWTVEANYPPASAWSGSKPNCCSAIAAINRVATACLAAIARQVRQSLWGSGRN